MPFSFGSPVSQALFPQTKAGEPTIALSQHFQVGLSKSAQTIQSLGLLERDSGTPGLWAGLYSGRAVPDQV